MKAILCGYYGMGNGGDEALLASLLQMLPEQVTPIVLSGNPETTYKAYGETYGVKAIDRFSGLALAAAFHRADAFIFGGGSLMQDATSLLSPFYYGGLMGLAQRRSLATVAWAQGIGPLNRGIVRRLTRSVFAGCDGVSVRDAGSAQLLAQWQVPCVMAPDPVWALAATAPPQLATLPPGTVAISLRPHPLLTPERLDCLTQALVTLQQQTQAHVLLVTFQPQRDSDLAHHLQAHLSGSSEIVALANPRQLKGLFQGVKLAISMRLHGLIMAAAEGCACVALGYDPKISQLMEALGLPGWELAQLPDANVVANLWLEQYHQGQGLSEVQVGSLCDRALMHRDMLQEVLKS
jgi:polysaccharide pyruvyl transferase CsaB